MLLCCTVYLPKITEDKLTKMRVCAASDKTITLILQIVNK